MTATPAATAVVLARGLGRRMQEDDGRTALEPAQARAAAAGHKGLMPIGPGGGRPFLDYVLSSLADAGCSDAILVVPPEHHAMRERYAPARIVRLAVHFAVQQEASGTADAVLASEPLVRDRPFLTLNADNLYPVEVLRALTELDGPGLAGFERGRLAAESGFPPERVAAFAVLEVDAEGWLTGLREKPDAAVLAAAGPGALISMNVWRFDERIFHACRDVGLSPRGERELPEAVALAVRRGVRFRVLPARGAVLDLSRRADIARVTAQLADREVRL